MDPTPTSFFRPEYHNSYIVTDNPTLVETQLHQHVYTFNNTLPRPSVLGITDCGCTNIIMPLHLAQHFNLPVSPLLQSFPMHFAETGSYATIALCVNRPPEYVWNFIAVTDKISEVLIDIKHPVRNGYSFIADDVGASLILSRPPYTTVLHGPVQPNGTYKWDLQQVLDLKIPLPVWADNPKQTSLLTPFLGSSHPLTTVTTLEKGARRTDKSKSSTFGIGFNNSSKPYSLALPFVPATSATAFVSTFVSPPITPTTPSVAYMDVAEPHIHPPSTTAPEPITPHPVSLPVPPPQPTTPPRKKQKTVLLIPPSSSDGPWATHSKAKGKRATYEQIRYMNILHNASGHLADSSALEVFKTWHGLPEWLTPSLYEAFLRSAHCLLCEIYRRQKDHPSGSGIPSQTSSHLLSALSATSLASTFSSAVQLVPSV